MLIKRYDFQCCFMNRNYLSNLNEDQQTRFEFYVRSKINATQVAKIMEETVKKRSETLQISDEVNSNYIYAI